MLLPANAIRSVLGLPGPKRMNPKSPLPSLPTSAAAPKAADAAAAEPSTGATTNDGEALLAGTPYRFVARLGRGGMGEVVEGEHVALGKRVVIKLLHEHLTKRGDMVDRMRVEAQTLARLAHANVVDVTDFGRTADGRTYLVMERLVGKTLRQALRERNVLPVGEAIEYVRQALAALGTAHGAGIVHRDVKLDNIYLCDPKPEWDGRPRVKLLDFGIAKILDSAGARAPAPLMFPTEQGVAVGTPRFFSPEQARGQKVDQRTDIYAMGIVLYTLVAGRGPFHHITAVRELTRAHVTEQPAPPSTYAPQSIPPALDAAILRAIAKQPADRFQTADEFSAELDAIRTTLDAPPPRWRQTEALETVVAQPIVRAPAPAGPARPTVRMPELADRQDAARRAFEARATEAAIAPSTSAKPARPELDASADVGRLGTERMPSLIAPQSPKPVAIAPVRHAPAPPGAADPSLARSEPTRKVRADAARAGFVFAAVLVASAVASAALVLLIVAHWLR